MAGIGAVEPTPPPPDEPTITLTVIGSNEVANGGAGSFRATISEVRLVDTVLDLDNGGIPQAEIVTPQTILAGDTELVMFVGNTGGYDGPVIITVTTDIDVLNTADFTFTS